MQIARSGTLALVLALGFPMSLRAQEAGSRPDLGFTLRIQHPLQDFQSQVLDTSLGFGVGARARFTLGEHHGLTVRAEYDWYPDGGGMIYWDGPTHEDTIRVREQSLGLDYEWRYHGRHGGYLIVGPMYRRWSDLREHIYNSGFSSNTSPNVYAKTTPSSLGYSLGWGSQVGLTPKLWTT